MVSKYDGQSLENSNQGSFPTNILRALPGGIVTAPRAMLNKNENPSINEITRKGRVFIF